MMKHVECNPKYLIVDLSRYPSCRSLTPFSVGANPKFGMDFIFGDHFADKQMPHEKVVVHGLCNDLGNRGRIKFKERAMF